MAIAQLFFKKDNLIGDIKLDVIISEGATASARITKNPVEHGADINDHVIIDPMTFNMSGVVSDTKTNIIGAISQLSKIESITSALNRVNTPSKEAWEQLLQLHTDKTPFELVTNLRTYSNVVMQTISEIQDKNTSNGLFFTASFMEIILVGGLEATTEQFNDEDTADMAGPATTSGQKELVEAIS